MALTVEKADTVAFSTYDFSVSLSEASMLLEILVFCLGLSIGSFSMFVFIAYRWVNQSFIHLPIVRIARSRLTLRELIACYQLFFI